jgi:branched-chain amino acid transport system ATP-binding protein
VICTLKLDNVNAGYGKLQVLKDMSLEVREKEIVALLGSNGAGKTTTLRTISGLLQPTSGTIEFLGKKINNVPPDKVVKLGIAQCPEARRIFPDLTVYENLAVMGAYVRKDKEGIKEDLNYVYELYPILKDRQKQRGGTLSGGEQQMLAIGRALMSKPRLLLLDEPTFGLSPLFVSNLAKSIQDIRKKGTTVFLVEQNALMALSITDRAYILELGRVVLEGESEKLLHDERVRQAYLGL